jgi:hypothetical protein
MGALKNPFWKASKYTMFVLNFPLVVLTTLGIMILSIYLNMYLFLKHEIICTPPLRCWLCWAPNIFQLNSLQRNGNDSHILSEILKCISR